MGLPGSFVGAPKAPDRCHCFLKTSWVCAFFVWLDVGAIGVVGLVVVVAVVVAGLGLCLFFVARCWCNRGGGSRGRGGRGGRWVGFVPFLCG